MQKGVRSKSTKQRIEARQAKRGALRSVVKRAEQDSPSDAPSDRLPLENGVLVLNHNYEPLNICGLHRGMTLLFLDKADVLRFSERTVRSAEDEHLMPSVLRLRELVKRPTPQLKISRKSILARDDYSCQYCGSRQSLTLDHVFPRHRGGETSWENVVCCCLRCNNKKGPLTPQEAGMRLPHPPIKPRYVPYISFPRFVSAMRRPEWREYLEGYGKGLEKY